MAEFDHAEVLPDYIQKNDKKQPESKAHLFIEEELNQNVDQTPGDVDQMKRNEAMDYES